MQITVQGVMTTEQMHQLACELIHRLKDDYAITHSRGFTIFVNPVNELGQVVFPHTRDGRVVSKIEHPGPYPCVADTIKPWTPWEP